VDGLEGLQWITMVNAGPRHGARLDMPVRAADRPFPDDGGRPDVGCGHGLLVNLLSRDPLRRGLRLCGIDHDAAKIEAARRTALPGVDFSTASLRAFAGAAFDAVSIFDVLYTVKREIWGDILTGCFRALGPGGTLIVKKLSIGRVGNTGRLWRRSCSRNHLRDHQGDRPR
jgi:SAM-dependent methyltransferase